MGRRYINLMNLSMMIYVHSIACSPVCRFLCEVRLDERLLINTASLRLKDIHVHENERAPQP